MRRSTHQQWRWARGTRQRQMWLFATLHKSMQLEHDPEELERGMPLLKPILGLARTQ